MKDRMGYERTMKYVRQDTYRSVIDVHRKIKAEENNELLIKNRINLLKREQDKMMKKIEKTRRQAQ